MDVLKKMSETVEGKAFLANIMLQMKLSHSPPMHPHSVNIEEVRAVLHGTQEASAQTREEAKVSVEAQRAHCADSVRSLTEVANDAHAKFLGYKRRHENAAGELLTRRVARDRADEELDNYKRIRTFVEENHKSWSDFYGNAIANFDSVSALVGEIGGHLESHLSGEVAFVQLPKSYHTGLAQLKIKFSSIENDLTGMKPVISSLIGLMNSPPISRASIRLHLKSVFHQIAEGIQERRDELEEENAHQSALFDTLTKALNDNVDRAEGGVAFINEAISFLEGKEANLAVFTDSGKDIADRAESILTHKIRTCKEFERTREAASVRLEKIDLLARQLEEVLATDVPAHALAFIEKKMKKD